MAKFQLVLLIHAHQPVGNFEEVMERAYRQCYLPFVEVLERHAAIRLGLHYSGSLLEWMAKAHGEFFERLGALVRRGQVEMVGGGFYEPILISIPAADRREQIKRLADYIETHFGQRPRGAWLTERVWEPQLPSTLAGAGVEYTLVDDNQFLGAGIEPDGLYGPYVAEDLNATVRLLPGLKSLRYLIPYRSVEEVLGFLRGEAEKHPRGLATMGDDCEKFGVWPGTHEHCYGDGWLDRFYSAVEQNSEWLETAAPGDAAMSRAPLGRADLSAASYAEMMEWALPTPARRRFQALEKEFESRPEAQPYLHGGTWRNFFTKYAEANLLHKKMLHVSAKVQMLARRAQRDARWQEACEQAKAQLLRAQCNDPYWHGVFGGVYSPHLRSAAWNSLVRAEAIADGARHRKASYQEGHRLDLDADGHEEIYFTSERYAALVRPGEGGTLAALDFRAAGATLINSIMRRPEAYHERLKNLPAEGEPQVLSIHEQVRAKEPGLTRWLHYDRWPRSSFRLLVFGADKTFPNYEEIRLEEDASLAGGDYAVRSAGRCEAVLERKDSEAGLFAQKRLSFHPSTRGFEARCEVTLNRVAAQTVRAQVGLEVILNFYAPNAPDRYFEARSVRQPLRWAGALPASELRLVDEWQKIEAKIEAPEARDFWIAPIEAVSDSEEGFERVYQGSQILCVWPLELAPGQTWSARVVLHVERLG